MKKTYIIPSVRVNDLNTSFVCGSLQKASTFNAATDVEENVMDENKFYSPLSVDNNKGVEEDDF